MKFNGTLIASLIDKHKIRRQKMIKLYNNYKGKELAIEQKEVSRTSKANNKIRSNFRGVIVDQKNGYLMGSPIQFGLDSLPYQDHLYELYDTELKRFLTRNRAEDILAETEKMSSICGYSAWLAYFDSSAKERFIELNPWDVIVVENDRTGERYGIYYYTVEVEGEDGKREFRTKAECYNDVHIEYWITDKDGNFVRDTKTVEENIKIHGYKKCPLIKSKNNEEEIGDFEKVEDYIEKYEFLLSTIQDEVDQFRLAYMVITGAEITNQQLELIKETGAFSGLEPEDKVEFVIKEINDTFLENHKNTLKEDIYKFSSTVDMNNEKFTGQTGEARKWYLIPLENKAKIKERKTDKALRDLFEVICTSWNINKGLMIDYLDIYFKFNRNIPVDLLYLAEVSAKLKGMVSEDTRLSVLSGLVDDVEWEKQKMEEEALGSISLDPFTTELLKPSGEGGAE